MLGRTLTTSYLPGTVLRGDVPGAAWTYLLPRLDLERIVCLGGPNPSALETLARLGRELIVFCRTNRELSRAVRDYPAAANGRVARLKTGAALPGVAGSVDLIYLAARWASKRFERDADWARELRRILKPEGRVYGESLRPSISQERAAEPSQPGWWVDRYVLSPVLGDVQSATRTDDLPVVRAFDRTLVERPVVLADIFTKRWGRARRGTVRRIASALRHAEGRVGWSSVLARYTRFGILAEPAGASRPDGSPPPRYLCALARSGGLDIDRCRFGLVADSRYRSRKTLFVLFPTGEARPRYLAKLSRTPEFNDRVERERDALDRLATLDDEVVETVPQTLFFGYHGGLAVLGQQMVDGRPFVERSDATSACPRARQVIAWLTRLGCVTARDPEVSAAGAFEALIDRFAGIYPLPPRGRELLRTQAERLRQSHLGCPSVFLHGDPHTTNLLVTPDERIAAVDWEASDPRGMPLWDLFVFLGAFGTLVSSRTRRRGRPTSFERTFLLPSDLHALTVSAVRAYLDALGLDSALVEPLFYGCWIHRALREAWTLLPGQLAHGRNFTRLLTCIDHRNEPGLQAIFSGGRSLASDTADAPRKTA